MEHFALLRQKALAGRNDNHAVLTALQGGAIGSAARHGGSRDHRHDSENEDNDNWELSLHEARIRYGDATAQAHAAAAFDHTALSDEARAYFKAVDSGKRGGDALVEHIERKTAKLVKRRRRQDGDGPELAGVALSAHNAEFNSRLA